ncbi:hypothetical protein SPLC1_S202680 [Arthrospira platensis C1]|nr:hypothetical protein SPLC1_S202680 [Arthrospira platensis C1]
MDSQYVKILNHYGNHRTMLILPELVEPRFDEIGDWEAIA